MEKTEALNKLKKAGYQVQFDSSVVTILLSKNQNSVERCQNYAISISFEPSQAIIFLKRLDIGLKLIYNNGIKRKG